jgi:ribose 5-phosphate isomerase B
MIVAVASDHAGTALIDTVLEAVRQAGHTPLDLGTHSQQSSDYPDFAELVGKAVTEGRADRGVVICGSGVGICIAANKIKGIYAAICHDTYSAHQGVEHDNMNVLCLGGRIIGTELAKELVTVFLSAQFNPQERFIRRANKVKALENK